MCEKCLKKTYLCVRVHVIISLRQFLRSLRSQSLQSCLTLCDAMYCNLPGSYVCEILQARMLEWVATSSSRGSSWPRDWTYVSCASCIAGDYLPLSMEITVQSLSHVWLFVTPWTAASQDSLSITNSQSLLKLMSIKSVMPYNHSILCRPLFLLPSIFPNIRVFSNESALSIRWPKYWSFSFNISPSKEHLGLIDLL